MYEHEWKPNKFSQPESHLSRGATELTPQSQPSALNEQALSRSNIMQLQRTIGNQAVTQLLQKSLMSSKREHQPVQRKKMIRVYQINLKQE